MISAHSFNTLCNKCFSIIASVVINVSIVARLGAIIPAPFVHPPIVISPLFVSTHMAVSFTVVSVVIIAFAKSSPLSSANPSTSTSFIPVIVSTGKGTPITPVDAINTLSAFISRASA